MAIRRRKEKKNKRISFKSAISKKKKKREFPRIGPSLIKMLKITAIACVLAGAVIGLLFLDKYVKKTAPAQKVTIELELLNVPSWVTSRLKEDVIAIAGGKDNELRLDENTALSVQYKIEKTFCWLDDVTVRTTHNGLQIEGRWRKPIALIKWGINKYYVDADKVLLDFVPMPEELPIVEITGLSPLIKTPALGEVWQRDDLDAAVAVLILLSRRDQLETSQKPLLSEIASIDVSNFNGRKNNSHAHIILYAKDYTEIMWGAEVGNWQQYLESTDEQKLAKLYSYYKEEGTLLGRAKYINLRDPKYKVPLPIDKY
jgi:uncharacterized protein YacL (UPF0231 family)